MNTSDKILAREVIKEKTDDGKDTFKIIVRNPRLGGQGSFPPENRSADQARLVRPVSPTGQTGPIGQTGASILSDRPGDRPGTFKPHRSNTHILDHDSDGSDDDSKEVYATEFVWPEKLSKRKLMMARVL